MDGLIDPLKPPRGAGQRILYLDFDGVLHHENVMWSHKQGPHLKAPPQYRLFQHVPPVSYTHLTLPTIYSV